MVRLIILLITPRTTRVVLVPPWLLFYTSIFVSLVLFYNPILSKTFYYYPVGYSPSWVGRKGVAAGPSDHHEPASEMHDNIFDCLRVGSLSMSGVGQSTQPFRFPTGPKEFRLSDYRTEPAFNPPCFSLTRPDVSPKSIQSAERKPKSYPARIGGCSP